MKNWPIWKVQVKAMSFYKVILGIFILSSLSACANKPQDNQLIVFADQEKGIAPYQTRIIVTPNYVRFDDGENSKSYTLFDRKTKIASTVDTEERTILVMHPKSVKVDPPFEMKYESKDLGDIKDAPKIMGKVPRHYQDYVNGKLCFDIISVNGMLPDTVKALSSFHQMLASDSKVTFGNMPADMLDPCTIAMDTFAPTRYLQHGFPVRHWHSGYSSTLVDFKDHYTPDPKLFELPKGYFSYTVEQIRAGLVDLDKRQIRSATPAKKNEG